MTSSSATDMTVAVTSGKENMKQKYIGLCQTQLEASLVSIIYNKFIKHTDSEAIKLIGVDIRIKTKIQYRYQGMYSDPYHFKWMFKRI